ncbi:MAG: hypothetical protein ACOYXT_11210 [Bacteroidota bacterium]
MKTESENLSARQSLDIITSMITQAKGNVQRNSFYFLLWGWVVAVANLGMYALTLLQYDRPYIVWVITIPAWIISLYKGFRQSREERISTHFDKISMWLWISFGICVFTLVAFGYKINYQLNPAILLLCAIPTFISGVILRFTPLMLGGASFWIFSIIDFLTPMESQPLVGAIAIICGYLVPGYLLKNKKDNV